MSDRPIRYQIIPIVIPASGNKISTSAVKTDKLYQKVTGIQVTCEDATGLNKTTFQKFNIDAREIYPADYDPKLLRSDAGVGPNERYDHDIDERANDSSVDITVQDGASAAAYPYTINVILRLENEGQEKKRLMQKLYDGFMAVVHPKAETATDK